MLITGLVFVTFIAVIPAGVEIFATPGVVNASWWKFLKLTIGTVCQGAAGCIAWKAADLIPTPAAKKNSTEDGERISVTDIVHEAQDTHLCTLFIGAHGDTGDYEYALDAANSAAKHLRAIQAELPATSPLARDAGTLAQFVRAAQRNLSQQRPADNPDELLDLATSLKERLERRILGVVATMMVSLV